MKSRLTIMIEEKDRKRLEKMCQEEGISMSYGIRRALQLYFRMIDKKGGGQSRG